MKPVTLNFVGFYVAGVADISLCGGYKGYIDMKLFKVKHLC